MVQSIDDVSDVFAHITVYIVRLLQEVPVSGISRLVVRRWSKRPSSYSLVELVQTVGEKTKGQHR